MNTTTNQVALKSSIKSEEGRYALRKAEEKINFFEANCSNAKPRDNPKEETQAEYYLREASMILEIVQSYGLNIDSQLNRLIGLNRTFGSRYVA